MSNRKAGKNCLYKTLYDYWGRSSFIKMCLPLNSIVKNTCLHLMACYIIQLGTHLHEWDYQYYLCNKNTNKHTDILPGLKKHWVYSVFKWGNYKRKDPICQSEACLKMPMRHPVALKIHKIQKYTKKMWQPRTLWKTCHIHNLILSSPIILMTT